MKKSLFIFALTLTLCAPWTQGQSNTNPLCFTAKNGSVEVSFNIQHITHSIQYSTDGSNWSTYTSNTVIPLAENGKIYFSAEADQTSATAFGQNSRSSFTSTDGGTVEASGNIMSLYGPSYPNLPFQESALSYLFYNCNLLTTMPELPASNPTDYFYQTMLGNCSSLIVNKPVPGTTNYIASDPVSYRSPVYNTTGDPTSGILRWDTLQCTSYTLVEDTTTTLNTGWYVVTGSDVLTGTLTCNGTVHLILADSAQLTASGISTKAGITVSGNGNSLTVYSQSTNPAQMGVLISTGGQSGAGIGGGTDDNGSNITINGGTVTANGGKSGAGIGGGANGSGSNITINGGTVTANGRSTGAGIGGGAYGSGFNITINGGEVTANGGQSAAGIGGGTNGSGSNITINGGTVTANGISGAAGIGGGASGSGYYITINGGTVTATGGSGAAGIGGGTNGSGSNIIVSTYLVVKADNNNPPTTEITNTGSDLTSSLAGKRYVTVEPAATAIITANVNDTVMGYVEGAGEYVYGTTATLTAVANEHYHFVDWSNGETSDVLSFVVEGDSTVTANFAIDQHTITVQINGNGSVIGEGTYNYGDQATLTATADAGYKFDGWEIDGFSYKDATITFTVEKDMIVVANFIVESSVEETEADNYVAYVEYNEFVVSGVAGHTVSVYDMNGRLVSTVENAADVERFAINAAGVYVICVNNMTTTRVIVK